MTKRVRIVEKTGRLDDLLLSAVDETMKQIFGEASTKAIYGCARACTRTKTDNLQM